MPDAATLGGFVLTSLLLALSPGPDNFYVLAQSATHGFRAGLVITLGLCTGLLVHTALVCAGMALAMQDSPALVHFVQLVGAGYLLFIAFSMWRHKPQSIFGQPFAEGVVRLYRRGFFLNLTNPKVSLFFLFFLPQFVIKGGWPVPWQLALLGVMFIFSALVVFASIAWFGGRLTQFLNQHPDWLRRLNRTAAVCLAAVAFHMIFSATAVTL